MCSDHIALYLCMWVEMTSRLNTYTSTEYELDELFWEQAKVYRKIMCAM